MENKKLDCVRKRGNQWSNPDEIRALIHFWDKYYNDLKKAKRNLKIYDSLSKDLASQGFLRSPVAIRTKVKNLASQYRTEKDIQIKYGHRSSKWIYFKLIDDILGRNRLFNILCSDGLISPSEETYQELQAAVHDNAIIKLEVEEEVEDSLDEQDAFASLSSPAHSLISNPDFNELQAIVCDDNEMNKSEENCSDQEETFTPVISSINSVTPVPNVNGTLASNEGSCDKISNTTDELKPIRKNPSVGSNDKTICGGNFDVADDSNSSKSKQKLYNHNTGSNNKTTCDGSDSTSDPKSLRSKKRLFSFSTDDYPVLIKTLESVKDVFQKSNSKESKISPESVDEIFGQYVGATLASIPDSIKKETGKIKIMELLTKLKYGD